MIPLDSNYKSPVFHTIYNQDVRIELPSLSKAIFVNQGQSEHPQGKAKEG